MSLLNDTIFNRYNHSAQMRHAKEGEQLINSLRPGTESQAFNVGDVLTHTGTGIYKAGVTMRVSDVLNDSGYYRYADENGRWHRQKDLIQ